MREILFKAKRKNWRELPKEEWWVEGYPVKYQPCASKDEWIYGIVPTYASALYIIEIDPETPSASTPESQMKMERKSLRETLSDSLTSTPQKADIQKVVV